MIHDVPTMMVSIDNPYHLIDAPRIPTYINAYTSEDIVVETLVEKIAGESTFKGVSPVDAFAGYFNANKVSFLSNPDSRQFTAAGYFFTRVCPVPQKEAAMQIEPDEHPCPARREL